jgi:antitoxin ParD1/3/4
MPTSLNVSLPRELKEFVVREVAAGGYGTASEYIRELLRERAARRERELVDRKILEALAGPGREMKPGDWREFRERMRRKIGKGAASRRP